MATNDIKLWHSLLFFSFGALLTSLFIHTSGSVKDFCCNGIREFPDALFSTRALRKENKVRFDVFVPYCKHHRSFVALMTFMEEIGQSIKHDRYFFFLYFCYSSNNHVSKRYPSHPQTRSKHDRYHRPLDRVL